MAGRNTPLHDENDDSYIAVLGKRLRHCDTVMTVHLGVEICPELKSDDAEQPAVFTEKYHQQQDQTADRFRFSRLRSRAILRKENLTGIRFRIKQKKNQKHMVFWAERE